MKLYGNEGSTPKRNAQRNLCGRTHYVDDETLRWHKSRVLAAHATAEGLLFALVTSDALDMNNTKRGFRYAIFDLFGTCLERPELDAAFKSAQKATDALNATLNTLNAKAVTLAAIEQQRLAYLREIHELALQVEKIETPCKP